MVAQVGSSDVTWTTAPQFAGRLSYTVAGMGGRPLLSALKVEAAATIARIITEVAREDVIAITERYTYAQVC